MPEQLYKLSPHRDLQCYFFMPSAIAAMSNASESGFTVTGKWRQQFDWAIVEWNRDNTFEHPSLRYLPDGDLSGLTLSYTEQRCGCILPDSNLFPTVAWNKVRIWTDDGQGNETIYYVDFNQIATSQGAFVPASGSMTVSAVPESGARVGLAWLEEHYYYIVGANDDETKIAAGLAAIINDPSLGSPSFTAASAGPLITVSYNPNAPNNQYPHLAGSNGNRIGMYGFTSSASTNPWQQPSVVFSGGQSPYTYNVTLNFSNLRATVDPLADPTVTANLYTVPTNLIRKIRWTWAADLQSQEFVQTPFQVVISNWTVAGTNRAYYVAGPGSRRIEDTDQAVAYTGSSWSTVVGNFSGSRIHCTANQGDSCAITYSETATHQLFLGTRLLSPGATVSVVVDGVPVKQIFLNVPGEDVLIRAPLGSYGPGAHTVTLTHAGGPSDATFYFDFLEIAYPSTDLPDFPVQTQLALATDWDTYHSQSLPAERTAWMIQKLGFQGRVNHYAGALWFYELVATGMQYATAVFEMPAPPFQASAFAEILIGSTKVEHLILPDETADTLAQAFALLINNGTNAVWASANGPQLTITATTMGAAGNGLTISIGPDSVGFAMTPSSQQLSGGIDGTQFNGLDPTDTYNLASATGGWCTDLTASPRMNPAAIAWHSAYFAALKAYGMDVVASFSTELGNGDPTAQAGIAQRYPDGSPVVVNTPALQTNFSPASLAYWSAVYLEMAGLQNDAGLVPYLQFGEVQWWYNPKPNVGMGFYDDYTQQQFLAKYGVAMQTIVSNTVSPSDYPNECAFLPALIGAQTAAIRGALQASYPNCRCEVLYPTDANDTTFNQVINYPSSDWTPQNLTRLKTENFNYTSSYRLDLNEQTIGFSAAKGFLNSQRNHLVGISDAWTAWRKEVDLAQSQGLECVVLFALDQYCLIGYGPPPFVKLTRSSRQA